MKNCFLTLVISFVALSVIQAQDLEEFNSQRLNLTANGMLVLGTWGLANLTVNPVLQFNATGSRKYFHQMNTMWGAVNLGLAGVGYYNAIKGNPSLFSLAQTISEQQSMEKILLLNTGLDIAYLSTGFFLREKSKSHTNRPERLYGYGNSLILQGAWLFAFDLGFYLLQNKQGKGLGKIIDGLAVTPNGVMFNLQF